MLFLLGPLSAIGFPPQSSVRAKVSEVHGIANPGRQQRYSSAGTGQPHSKLPFPFGSITATSDKPNAVSPIQCVKVLRDVGGTTDSSGNPRCTTSTIRTSGGNN